MRFFFFFLSFNFLFSILGYFGLSLLPVGVSPVVVSGGYSLIAVHWLLIVVASFVAYHGP